MRLTFALIGAALAACLLLAHPANSQSDNSAKPYTGQGQKPVPPGQAKKNDTVGQPATNEHSGGTGTASTPTPKPRPSVTQNGQTGRVVTDSHMRNEMSGRAGRDYGVNRGAWGRPHYNIRAPWLRRCTWQWHEHHRRRVCL